MSGKLILIPTPIDDESLLCDKTKSIIFDAISKNSIILMEEEKEGRRRWLRFGLPRECIENFVIFNEHTQKDLSQSLIKNLKSNQDIILMSDCGLPAFCDPGTELVNQCHLNNIQVTSAPFGNSIALAISLCGFNHSRFIFEGFIPVQSPDRQKSLKRILKQKEVSIIMDTPYRLNKLIDELDNLNCSREVFIGLDLNKPEELLLRGSIAKIRKQIEKEKREFILILGPINE